MGKKSKHSKRSVEQYVKELGINVPDNDDNKGQDNDDNDDNDDGQDHNDDQDEQKEQQTKPLTKKEQAIKKKRQHLQEINHTFANYRVELKEEMKKTVLEPGIKLMRMTNIVKCYNQTV